MKLRLRKPPWYTAGLAFECVQCGRCCAGPEEGFVWVTPDEIAAIAEHLGISVDEMRDKYCKREGRRWTLIERDDNRDCIFLVEDERGRKVCRIYPVRPTQCRTWPFWPTNLTSEHAWAMAGLRCPGINRGKVFPCHEIEARRDETHK